jgi:hypothetical protein
MKVRVFPLYTFPSSIPGCAFGGDTRSDSTIELAQFSVGSGISFALENAEKTGPLFTMGIDAPSYSEVDHLALT